MPNSVVFACVLACISELINVDAFELATNIGGWELFVCCKVGFDGQLRGGCLEGAQEEVVNFGWRDFFMQWKPDCLQVKCIFLQFN